MSRTVKLLLTRSIREEILKDAREFAFQKKIKKLSSDMLLCFREAYNLHVAQDQMLAFRVVEPKYLKQFTSFNPTVNYCDDPQERITIGIPVHRQSGDIVYRYPKIDLDSPITCDSSSFSIIDQKLYHKVESLIWKFGTIYAEKDKVIGDLSRFLQGIKTVDELKEKWPEGEKMVPTLKGILAKLEKPKHPVPAVTLPTNLSEAFE